MRKVKIYQRDVLLGTVECPDNVRAPMSPAELKHWPCHLLIRSKSWLFDVRVGDFTLEQRDDEVVIVAQPCLGPGDIGCIIGFEAAEGKEHYSEDTEMTALADQVLREHRGY